MFGADVVVVQSQRFAQAELEDLLRSGGEGDVAGRLALSEADLGLDLLADGARRDSEARERLTGETVRLAEQPEQEVLSADVVVLQPASLFLGEHDRMAGSVGESFEHARQRACARST